MQNQQISGRLGVKLASALFGKYKAKTVIARVPQV